MTDLSVKYFNNAMAGAPQVSNAWGDLVNMLDAVLVNGFNLKAIDRLSFADGLATATITTGHSYLKDQVVLIEGANETAYNGQFRIISVTSTTFSYAVNGTPASPATTATSLSAKVAPLGWEIAFSTTHKRAYRSIHPQSPGNLLLIDDSLKGASYAPPGPSGPTSVSLKTWRTSGPSSAPKPRSIRANRTRTGHSGKPTSGAGTSGTTPSKVVTRTMATAVAATATGCWWATTACFSCS